MTGFKDSVNHLQESEIIGFGRYLIMAAVSFNRRKMFESLS